MTARPPGLWPCPGNRLEDLSSSLQKLTERGLLSKSRWLCQRHDSLTLEEDSGTIFEAVSACGL
jgi:hypothetical protein